MPPRWGQKWLCGSPAPAAEQGGHLACNLLATEAGLLSQAPAVGVHSAHEHLERSEQLLRTKRWEIRA